MNRRPGLSAMLRIKNEEEFIGPCLQSINNIFDEIVIVDQGSTDKTMDLVGTYKDATKTTVYRFPYESRPNGPGHGDQPYDVHNRAYFYNWCFSKTTCKWVSKWDGDMIALDTLKNIFRHTAKQGKPGGIGIVGVDIVKIEDGQLLHSPRQFIGPEIRLFSAENGKTYWDTGQYAERFNFNLPVVEIEAPQFLHMKWCKPREKAQQSWPADWQKMEHFQRIMRRNHPCGFYLGSVPKCLTQII